jgi:hypothetical protein
MGLTRALEVVSGIPAPRTCDSEAAAQGYVRSVLGAILAAECKTKPGKFVYTISGFRRTPGFTAASVEGSLHHPALVHFVNVVSKACWLRLSPDQAPARAVVANPPMASTTQDPVTQSWPVVEATEAGSWRITFSTCRGKALARMCLISFIKINSTHHDLLTTRCT